MIKQTAYSKTYRKALLPNILWIFLITILIGFSYYWNIENIHNEKLNLALAEAKANWNKDASFRKWATLHGGLYVKPDERTPPNPYLGHLPKRDVETTDGTQLTLMNPAYMMRQMTEEFEKIYGIKGKITGKVQLNPINKPDEWQLEKLNLFEQGEVNEVYEQKMINGQPYLRYMKAMYMTKGCIKCHAILGFKDGDLRGGVSVSIPLAPYFSAAEKTGKSILITHLSVWILGIVLILIFARLIRRLFHTLIKSEKKTRDIIESAVDGIATLNEAEIIQTNNTSFLQLFGYEEEKEVLGKNISLFIHNPDKEEHDGHLEKQPNMYAGIKNIVGKGQEVVGLNHYGLKSIGCSWTESPLYTYSRIIFPVSIFDGSLWCSKYS